jgi:structure-specific recognition protein 1
MEARSAKGWSWGDYEIGTEGVRLIIDGALGFELPYREIANCQMPAKNELAFEFHQDDTMEQDTICELRMYVPDSDACDRITKEVMDRADLRATTGEAIVTLYDIPMVTPRGKYSLDMFDTFLRLHGKTHNYKILYKNITKAFLLPKPDGVHVAFVFGLEPPIRQGQTIYPFMVMQFSRDREEAVTINMPAAEIQRVYGDEISPLLEGKLFDVISRLIKTMVKVNIVVPGSFKSTADAHGLKCSIKASDGYLYPLQKSFLFVTKPVIHIRFEEVKSVEFARMNERSASTIRSFDLNITTSSGTFTFTGLDRQEYQILFDFLSQKKLPITKSTEEEEPYKGQALSDSEEDEDVVPDDEGSSETSSEDADFVADDSD